jgi:CBS domain-containing protein
MIMAKDWMTKNVVTITMHRSIHDAAKLMRDKNIGSVIVVEKEKPIGIITEKDIVFKVCASDKSPSKVKVEEIMSKSLMFAHVDDSVHEIIRRMSLAKVRRMPILDKEKLVGIITETDMHNIMTYIQKELHELLH